MRLVLAAAALSDGILSIAEICPEGLEVVFVYFRLFSLSGEDVSYVIQELLWLNAVLVWEDTRKKSGVAVSSSINFIPYN